MSPTTHQHNTSESDYQNIYERAFSDDCDLEAGPLINGISDYETAIKAHKAAHRYDATEREKRQIATKIERYKN